MPKTFVPEKAYKTTSSVAAKVNTSFYTVPAGQSLVFKRIERRNKVSNWFVFSWWGQEIKLTELATSHVQ